MEGLDWVVGDVASRLYYSTVQEGVIPANNSVTIKA